MSNKDQKDFKCQHCDKVFNKYSSLTSHRTRVHPEHSRVIPDEEKKFQCPDCGNKFKLNKDLLYHQRASCKKKLASNEQSAASTAHSVQQSAPTKNMTVRQAQQLIQNEENDWETFKLDKIMFPKYGGKSAKKLPPKFEFESQAAIQRSSSPKTKAATAPTIQQSIPGSKIALDPREEEKQWSQTHSGVSNAVPQSNLKSNSSVNQQQIKKTTPKKFSPITKFGYNKPLGGVPTCVDYDLIRTQKMTICDEPGYKSPEQAREEWVKYAKSGKSSPFKEMILAINGQPSKPQSPIAETPMIIAETPMIIARTQRKPLKKVIQQPIIVDEQPIQIEPVVELPILQASFAEVVIEEKFEEEEEQKKEDTVMEDVIEVQLSQETLTEVEESIHEEIIQDDLSQAADHIDSNNDVEMIDTRTVKEDDNLNDRVRLIEDADIKKLNEEMESFMDELRSMVTASTAVSMADADMKASDLIYAKQNIDCRDHKDVAKACLTEERNRKSHLHTLSTEQIQVELQAEHTRQAADKVLMFLSEQNKKHIDYYQAGDANVTDYLEQIKHQKQILQKLRGTTQNKHSRDRISQVIDRYAQFIEQSQSKSASSAKVFQIFIDHCTQCNEDFVKEIELKEAIREEKQLPSTRADLMLQHGFTRFYPRSFLKTIQEQLCVNGNQPNERRFEQIYATMNHLPVYFGESHKFKSNRLKTLNSKDKTNSRKLVDESYDLVKHVNQFQDEYAWEQVFKIPRLIFEQMKSPDAEIMKKSFQQVFHDLNQMRRDNITFKKKMRHWIKDLTVEIKTVIDKQVSVNLPTYSRAILAGRVDTERLKNVKKCIVSIMLIHRVVYTNHLEHLLKEVRRSLLSQIFSGCLPTDIGTAELYLADVFQPSPVQKELVLKERELIFTCSNALSQQIRAKGDETKINIQAKKRTLKRNQKKNQAQYNVDDQSRMKSIKSSVLQMKQLKLLNGDLHKFLSNVIDHAESIDKIFNESTQYPMMILSHILADLRDAIEHQWNVVNKDLKKKRKKEIDSILESHLSVSILQKLSKVASLAIARDRPVPKLESVAKMIYQFRDAIDSDIEPFASLLSKHISAKNSTLIKTIRCAMKDLHLHSTNEVLSAQNKSRWNRASTMNPQVQASLQLEQINAQERKNMEEQEVIIVQMASATELIELVCNLVVYNTDASDCKLEWFARNKTLANVKKDIPQVKFVYLGDSHKMIHTHDNMIARFDNLKDMVLKVASNAERDRLAMMESTKIVRAKPSRLPSAITYFLCDRVRALLNPGEWFNDEIINAYIELVNNYCIPQVPSGIDVIAFEVTVLRYICTDNLRDRNKFWTRHFLKNIINRYKHIDISSTVLLMPFHMEQYDHWALLVANTSTRQLTIVDSLTYRQDKLEMVKEPFVLRFSQYLEFNCKTGAWTIEVDELSPFQVNDDDRGMFLCMNMRSYINKYLHPIPTLETDYSPKGGRKLIGTTLDKRRLVDEVIRVDVAEAVAAIQIEEQKIQESPHDGTEVNGRYDAYSIRDVFLLATDNERDNAKGQNIGSPARNMTNKKQRENRGLMQYLHLSLPVTVYNKRATYDINISQRDYLTALDLNGADVTLRRYNDKLASPIDPDLYQTLATVHIDDEEIEIIEQIKETSTQQLSENANEQWALEKLRVEIRESRSSECLGMLDIHNKMMKCINEFQKNDKQNARAAGRFHSQLGDFFKTMNVKQMGTCDCGIAVMTTSCRLMGKSQLKLLDIYNMFIYENGTCIIDIAIFIANQGISVNLHAFHFNLDSESLDPLVVQHISNMHVALNKLQDEKRTRVGPTNLSEMTSYLHNQNGFIIVLLDYNYIPYPGEHPTTSQFHYVIMFATDIEYVHIVESQSKKAEKLKIKDFEKARLAEGTDQGCIFIDYNHKC